MTAATAYRSPGSGLAPGAVIAASWRADRPIPEAVAHAGPDDVVAAFAAVAAELDRLADQAREQGRQAAADIVAVGALIAGDVALVDAARDAVAAGADPVAAVRDAVEAQARAIEDLPDPTLRERGADIRQVGRRVAERLARAAAGEAAPRPAGAFVLVADEVGPADLLEWLGQGLAGIVAVRGGANSHAAIIARSTGLPLVTGVDPAILDLPDGTPLLVDAGSGADAGGGLVVAEPGAAEVGRATDASVRGEARRAVLAAERGRPHLTADGWPFTLLCNVASDLEARTGLEAGAEGIGLLRTELPFLDAGGWPAEADHRRALRPILAEAAGRPVTVRLLDFAGDKVPPFLRGGGSDPAASGRVAGLAALLGAPDALAVQLRAAIDLGRTVDLRIMVPMVRAAADVTVVRTAAEAVAGALWAPPVRVGAMIETVAAGEAIADLARVADFFSIGTNDLTGEVLDLDRRDPRARPELAAHPRVLEIIGRVVREAERVGRPLSVCGDSAAHPGTLPLLVGAGVRTVSVACARVDETRYLLRRLDTAACRRVFTDALRLHDADEVLALVRDRIGVTVP
jgi:phosphoenolpyruvate-protein kinase (PTS system EI component)